MRLISTKLRDSARRQACTFCIPGICNSDRSTTVLAHIPSEWKGIGTKSPDFSAAFACSACHDHFDQHRMSREDELHFALRALQRTQAIWIASGLMVVPVDAKRSMPAAKVLPRRHLATREVIS